ncbi:uncharacterized protein MYCFIDRAFT_71227 [Pseudocercospora fijiensis CIRAD86]|uniref:Meiotic expression up-regulated protein 6 PH domain-containing protein n=1 Tax=Pseudocercospora fijiensis (strain CIRAD86) TaxID=383855 RepID=N1Q611_PSEFD|nr:uncharacterized protein MYCFIDRAFT_71227 [Pseudocercospora fijiensis CIRAD86]EME87580.1 hypothetical protein MYCFIDRAFT_209544 [Pseudocercospora fijiensis CIRAD86]
MSAVQDTPATLPAATTEPAAPETPLETKVESEAPAAAVPDTTTTTDQTAAATDDVKADAAEKAVEPIAEGQLAYKGPGVIKSLIPSKKEFWLSDDAVTPQKLDLYLRGEKPEVSHPVAAWASQTGKGLLFFNKKGDSDKTHPADVLALYDATDLKKGYPHEFSFKIGTHTHTFKAEDELKRDGWYLSIEKAIELGKASKEEVTTSEGYKAELEKLNKSNTAAAGAATRSLSKPKKSTEAPAEQRTNSSDGEVADNKKEQKSRSTSRGLLNRLKAHRDETEKKEEKAEKDEAKTESEAAPVAAATESAPIAAAMAAEGSPAAAEAQASDEKAAETPAGEEKLKPSKRGSIFGRVSSTWSKIQSPAKEKDQKEAELKPEPAKDAPVSENPPVLPETATASTEVADTAIPAVEQSKAEEPTEVKKEEPATSPSKEKSNFLSGIGGFIKRNRSVSPSTMMKEPAKKEETPAVEETPAAAEPAKVEEPAPATEAVAAVEPSAETPPEKVEEPKSETTTPNKRQSVLGSLGRRASKALNRIQAPKKEASAPAAPESKKEEAAAETKPAEETPLVNGEAKKAEPEAQQSIGDVVPDAVNVGQPQHQTTPTVTATA